MPVYRYCFEALPSGRPGVTWKGYPLQSATVITTHGVESASSYVRRPLRAIGELVYWQKKQMAYVMI